MENLNCLNTPGEKSVYDERFIEEDVVGCQIGDLNGNGCIDLVDANIFSGMVVNYWYNGMAPNQGGYTGKRGDINYALSEPGVEQDGINLVDANIFSGIVVNDWYENCD